MKKDIPFKKSLLLIILMSTLFLNSCQSKMVDKYLRWESKRLEKYNGGKPWGRVRNERIEALKTDPKLKMFYDDVQNNILKIGTPEEIIPLLKCWKPLTMGTYNSIYKCDSSYATATGGRIVDITNYMPY